MKGRKSMSLIRTTLVILGVGLLLSPVVFEAFGEEDWRSKLVTPGVLTVGTSGNCPPYTHYNEEDELVGIDVELIEGIASYLDLEIKLVTMDWVGLLPGLIAGQFDAVVAGVTWTTERNESPDLLLTDIYMVSGIGFNKRKGDTRLQTIEDVCGLRMGGVQGGSEWKLALEKLPEGCNIDGEIQLYPSVNEMYLDLGLGRIDVVALGVHPAAFVAISGGYDVENFGPILRVSRKTVAVAPPLPGLVEDINALLESLRKAHALDWLIEKYVGDFRLPWELLEEAATGH